MKDLKSLLNEIKLPTLCGVIGSFIGIAIAKMIGIV